VADSLSTPSSYLASTHNERALSSRYRCAVEHTPAFEWNLPDTASGQASPTKKSRRGGPSNGRDQKRGDNKPVSGDSASRRSGIAIGGSYIGVGGIGIVSRVADTELLPFAAAGIGLLIGFGSLEVVFDPPSGERVWLLLGLATLNGQVLLGAIISETEQSVAFIAESVAMFVFALTYLAANTPSTNLASFLTVSTLTTLLFVIFGWPLYRFGDDVRNRAS
jgi:hypothetical protein